MVTLGLKQSYATQLPHACVAWQPAVVERPELLYFNTSLAEALQLPLQPLRSEQLAHLLCGNPLPDDAHPVAQIYAGHQFGHFSPRLGDGRAVLLGEIESDRGVFDLSFKGSGQTPFSRSGDGKAAVGPMLREVLISEALQALHIPTTRSLAVVATGETVYRESPLPGAILTRVAASHIRVGTFEYFAARGELAPLKQLADYTIARHYPELATHADPYLGLLYGVIERQAALIAAWMGIGFIHGVMNSDNMTLSGETIDYGPCAFMERYRTDAVFSSIDHFGRYAYKNQPQIAQWNLTRLAETLVPLMAMAPEEAVEAATAALHHFMPRYQLHRLQIMRQKLGLTSEFDNADDDSVLIERWLTLLEQQQIDYTLAWRALADAAVGNLTPLQQLFTELAPLQAWLTAWQQRCQLEQGITPQQRYRHIRQNNPWIIPRNHRVEEALAAATEGDLAPFQRLLQAITHPYRDDKASAPYAEPAPEQFMQQFQTFCGT
ncbi:YdiU family protein [Ectothiorhodospiraceae bacterium BW-2]|nr:YdiU family protein [Ectothiorhodospiraceae bacterium BW-2]